MAFNLNTNTTFRNYGDDDTHQDVDYIYYEDTNGVEDDDDEYLEELGPVPKTTRKSTKNRKLKRWDGRSDAEDVREDDEMLTTKPADEDQLLLLYVDYVCTQMGLALPWDAIGAAMEPRDPEHGDPSMTGEAVKQHLAKVHKHREGEGLRVPPKLDRSARRNHVATKTAAPSTPHSVKNPAPVPAPKRKVGPGRSVSCAKIARGEAPAHTPVKRCSSLLVPLTEAKKKAIQKLEKQKNKEAAKKAAANSTTGKLDSMIASILDGGLTSSETDELLAALQMRLPMRNKKAAASADDKDFEAIGIKNEPVSDDDLPLSKKSKGARKPAGSNKNKAKTNATLLDDTRARWINPPTSIENNTQASNDEQSGAISNSRDISNFQYPVNQINIHSQIQAGHGVTNHNQNSSPPDYQDFGLPTQVSYGPASNSLTTPAPAFTMPAAMCTQPSTHSGSNSSPFVNDASSSFSFSSGGRCQGYGTNITPPSDNDTTAGSSFNVDCNNDDVFGIIPTHIDEGNLGGLPTGSIDNAGNMSITSFPSFPSTGGVGANDPGFRYSGNSGSSDTLDFNLPHMGVAPSSASMQQSFANSPFDGLTLTAPSSQTLQGDMVVTDASKDTINTGPAAPDDMFGANAEFDFTQFVQSDDQFSFGDMGAGHNFSFDEWPQ